MVGNRICTGDNKIFEPIIVIINGIYSPVGNTKINLIWNERECAEGFVLQDPRNQFSLNLIPSGHDQIQIPI